MRHRLALNFVAELPFGKGKKYANEGVAASVFGGWTISGIFTARSGRPFMVTQSGNNVGTSMTGLPNQIGDPKGAETVDSWFNGAAFQAVTSGTFGNVKRNGMRGPDYRSLDFSLQRKFNLSSRFAASLRWDVFNALDRVNLGLPDRNVSSPATLGVISSLGGDPRLMQVSVRLTF